MRYKKCSICKKLKQANLVYFKSERRNNNGLTAYCRECKQWIDRIFSREYREKDPIWKKENNKRNVQLVRKLVKEYNQKYPERIEAGLLLRQAIKKGKVIRGKCALCGEERVDGHHPNYSKPLIVIWLCHKHHKQLHAGIIKVAEKIKQ